MNKEKLLSKIEYIVFFIYVLCLYIFGSKEETSIISNVILVFWVSIEIIQILYTKKFYFPKILFFLFLFAIYCYSSSFWAIDGKLAVAKAKTIILLFIFLLLSFNFFYRIEDGEERILKVLMYTGTFFSIYIILYYGIDNFFAKLLKGERIGRDINNVNVIGLQTSISVLIAIFFAYYNNKKSLYIIGIVPLIVSLGTGSKKVIIFLIVGSLLLIILRNFNRSNAIIYLKKMFRILIVIILIYCITLLPIFSNAFERFSKLMNAFTKEGNTDESTRLRLEFIDIGFKEFKNHPIFGIGAGNAGYLTIQVRRDYFTYLHNNYVELLATLGIIGFLLYYSIYLYIIVNCIKYNRIRNNYINILLSIFLVNLLIDYGVVSYTTKNTYLYLLLGLVVIEKIKVKNRLK